MQAARTEGHTQGYSEGTAAAEAKLNKADAAREEAIRGLLDVIANRITMAAESHATYVKNQEETMGKLVIAIARKLSGDALKSDPYANVESLLRECMGLIAGSPKIVIVVALTRSVDLKRRMDTLRPQLQGFEGELVVEEDPTLGEQDCRVEWKGGYGEHNAEALWKSIEAIVVQETTNAKEPV
jgi:flagellar biosynthesis/type III secretory pathway protein FliH